jgi:hypothetical protein
MLKIPRLKCLSKIRKFIILGYQRQFTKSTILTALMMVAVITPETSINFYDTTWRNIPEGCHLYTRHRDNVNLNYYIVWL